MAIYHCCVKIGSKSKGQSAVAASAYRSGTKMTDQQTGLVSDFTRKSGVVFSETLLCENAPSEYINREILWNAVHSIEKTKTSQLWREFEVAVPKEFTRDVQINTVRDFANKLVAQGMCVDWSLHDKGDGNPHAHIMATVRSINPDGTWAPKSRKVYDLDENGERIFQKIDKSGRKQYKNHKEDFNDWNKPERMEEWRSAWAECCNKKLQELGKEKIDHRSYERQGIDQEPTIHEGYVARQLDAQGKPSERVQLNNEIRERNRLLKQITNALKNIGEELKNLIEQKGSVINAGKQRIADLLSRRSRTVSQSVGGTSDRERGNESRVKKAKPSDSDLIINQSKLERRTAEEFLRLEAAQTEQSENLSELIRSTAGNIENSGTDDGESQQGAEDTDAIIRQSEAKINSSAIDRKNRDAERERLAAEERQRVREAERRERESAKKERNRSHGISR